MATLKIVPDPIGRGVFRVHLEQGTDGGVDGPWFHFILDGDEDYRRAVHGHYCASGPGLYERLRNASGASTPKKPAIIAVTDEQYRAAVGILKATGRI